MKFYAVLYSIRQLTVKLSISPRGFSQKTQPPNTKIMKRHKSKQGFESLVFDPLIGISFEKKFSESAAQNPGVLFHIHYTYHLLTSLTKVYEGMIKDRKMVIKDGKKLVLDRSIAKKYARKIPSIRNELRISPCVVETESGDELGMTFESDVGHIADITHGETRMLIEALEHFDTITASLVVGLLEEIEGVNNKLDIMQASIDDIRKDLKMLIQNSNRDIGQSTSLNWRPTNRTFY